MAYILWLFFLFMFFVFLLLFLAEWLYLNYGGWLCFCSCNFFLMRGFMCCFVWVLHVVMWSFTYIYMEFWCVEFICSNVEFYMYLWEVLMCCLLWSFIYTNVEIYMNWCGVVRVVLCGVSYVLMWSFIYLCGVFFSCRILCRVLSGVVRIWVLCIC